MTLGFSDHLNVVRDKDVSKLGPESAKTGLFYVLFTLGDMTLWSANIKPGGYQHLTISLSPYFVGALVSIFKTQFLLPPAPPL